jgi:phage I-like protein
MPQMRGKRDNMNIKDLILRKKIFEAEADVEKFLKDNEIDFSDSSTTIQTLIFDKSVFETEAEAREWAADHGFWSSKVDETDESFRLRQLAPSSFDEQSFRTIEIRRGIKAVIGKLSDIISSELQFSEKESKYKFVTDIVNLNINAGAPNIIEIARVVEGEHPTYGKIRITKEHLKSFVNNFNSKITGTDLAVNEDHNKREAFGWFKDVFLSHDENVCYGIIDWNKKGIQALSEKEYRYFSPEFRFNYVHPHSGKEHGATLLGGALTNYPFLKMEAITELNEKSTPNKGHKKVETIALSEHSKVVLELNAKVNEMQGKFDAVNAQNIELSNKVKTLEADAEKRVKEIAHQKLFDDGKINKAQLVALNEGKTMLEVISLNEPMNTKEKGSSNNKTATVELSDKEKEMASKLGLTEEEFIAANK